MLVQRATPTGERTTTTTIGGAADPRATQRSSSADVGREAPIIAGDARVSNVDSTRQGARRRCGGCPKLRGRRARLEVRRDATSRGGESGGRLRDGRRRARDHPPLYVRSSSSAATHRPSPMTTSDGCARASLTIERSDGGDRRDRKTIGLDASRELRVEPETGRVRARIVSRV